jgi:hypothetical protein
MQMRFDMDAYTDPDAEPDIRTDSYAHAMP